MKKTVVFLTIIMLFGIGVISVIAKGPAGDEERTLKGFDMYGYNYRANMFNGPYCWFDRNKTTFCDDYPNDWLIMKWSDEWLTTKCGVDEQGRGKRGCDMSTCECTGNSGVPGAWLTNHNTWYDEEGVKHEYFVKIVYMPEGCPEGYSIWGPYCIIQEVEGGLLGNYVLPVGFGAW